MAAFIKSLFSFKDKPVTSSKSALTSSDSLDYIPVTPTVDVVEKKKFFWSSDKAAEKKSAKAKSKQVERMKSEMGTPDANEYPIRVVAVDDYNIGTYFFKDAEAVQHDLSAPADRNSESYGSQMITSPVNDKGTLFASASYGGRGMSRSIVMELSKAPNGLYFNIRGGSYGSLGYVLKSMTSSIPIVVNNSTFTSIDQIKTAMATVEDVGPEPVIDRTGEKDWTEEKRAETKKIVDEYKAKQNSAKYRQSSLEYTWKPIIEKMEEWKKDGETVNILFVQDASDSGNIPEEAAKWMGGHIAAARVVKEMSKSSFW